MATSTGSVPRRRKFALIIANGNYNREENRLSYSRGNGQALSDALKAIGFKVTLVCDVEKPEMTSNIIDFSKTINDGDLVLFYYSGHCCQTSGKNYLIPLGDTHIEKDRDIGEFSIDFARTVLPRLVEKNPSYATICILDQCQAYLLKNKTASNVQGLREVPPTDGSFIQFACSANENSRDNVFCKHLLKHIALENVHITDVFQRISDDVYQERGGKQRPLSINGLGQRREVFLNQVIRLPPPPPVVPKLSTEQFFTEKKLEGFEEEYYNECKQYYRMTGEPLISVSEEIFDNSMDLPSSSLKFGIDVNCKDFDLQQFIDQACQILQLKTKDLVIKQIQEGSAIVEVDIFDKLETHDKKLKLKMIYETLTDKVKKAFAKMKMFFMFLGPIKSLYKKQKYRAEVKFNLAYNRTYTREHDFWSGPLTDRKDRGGKPYYCPVGWQRFSFYVTDKFDQKFNGWCIGYHGTKFSYGLSILLSGLKPATAAEHGAGIYLTPSIIYACHPRYSEVKPLDSSHREKFSKRGKYVQYVLECRVRPSKIRRIDKETLHANQVTIDPNLSNGVLEWVVDDQVKSVVDFNDPDSSVICTGLLTRVTDNHPGLLPESQWWHSSHLCDRPGCCMPGIDLEQLHEQLNNNDSCNIIFD